MSAWKEAGKALCEWFSANGRDLPWRHTRDPYRIWVSEVMLQQTRVETVLGYYGRFLEHFPDAASLASADLDEVFKLWEGLGYYRRAEYLKKGAGYITHELGGRFPQTSEELKRVPGIGPYTASAIAAVAFGERTAAVDGNVQRVTARLGGIRYPVGSSELFSAASEISLAMMPIGGAWAHTQAMMDLGATVCLPRNPGCGVCPLREYCTAFGEGSERELPVRTARKEKTVTDRAVRLILCGDKILVRRRPENGLLRGMWEFPADENGSDFLSCFRVLSRSGAPDKEHVFTHRIWRMTGTVVRVAEQVTPDRCRWIGAEELKALALPSAVASYRTFILPVMEENK